VSLGRNLEAQAVTYTTNLGYFKRRRQAFKKWKRFAKSRKLRVETESTMMQFSTNEPPEIFRPLRRITVTDIRLDT